MKAEVASKVKLSATVELRALSKQGDGERLGSWQELLKDKTEALHEAVHDWARRRKRACSFSFKGFLGAGIRGLGMAPWTSEAKVY